ncbi:hypothetical protein BSKO_09456 [Bryopsis sp. KO-2023]|nr:hypothetical protein BSKO_09456 [Bryopsis sp. KO-2023]
MVRCPIQALLIFLSLIVATGAVAPKTTFRNATVGRDSIQEVLAKMEEGGVLTLVYDQAVTILETVIVDKAVTIQGGGKQGPRLTCRGGGAAFDIRSGGVILKNMAIDGCLSHAIVFDSLPAAAAEDQVPTVQIDSLSITNHNGGVYHEKKKGGQLRMQISNCTFENGTKSAISLEGTASLVLSNSKFWNSTSGLDKEMGGCVALSSVPSSQFISNNFSECSAKAGGAISITDWSGDLDVWSVNVTDCRFENNRASQRGGGLYIMMQSQGSVVIEGSRFYSNRVGEQQIDLEESMAGGGGAFISLVTDARVADGSGGGSEMDVQVIDSYFSDNHILGFGTGMALWGTLGGITGGGGAAFQQVTSLHISRSVFLNNTSPRAGGGLHYLMRERTPSGRVECPNTPSIDMHMQSSIFESNSAEREGGAIYLSEGDHDVEGCKFLHNESKDQGGAIHAESSGSLLVSDSRFFHNTAKEGGGVAAFDGEAQLQNSSFEKNLALGGGAIYTSGQSLRILHSTFLENESHLGGAVLFFFDEITGVDCFMDDSVFMGNVAKTPTSSEREIGQHLSREKNGRRYFVGSGGAVAIINRLGDTMSTGSLGERPRLIFDTNTFERNSAVNGGALLAALASDQFISLDACRFVHNSARQTGGAGVVRYDETVWFTCGPEQESGPLSTMAVRQCENVQNNTVTSSVHDNLGDDFATLVLGGVQIDPPRISKNQSRSTLPNITVTVEVAITTPASSPLRLDGETLASASNGLAVFRGVRMLGKPGLHPLNFTATGWTALYNAGTVTKNVYVDLRECKPGRLEKLQSFHVEGIPLNGTIYGQDEYPLCKQGSSGPLCGSCDSGYGHSTIGQCVHCASNGWARFSILFGALWTLMFGILITWWNLPRNNDQVEYEEGGEVEMGNFVNGVLQPPAVDGGDVDEPRPIDILKASLICINFFQLNAFALVISFDWMSFISVALNLQEFVTQASPGGSWLVAECAFSAIEHKALIVAFLSAMVPFISAGIAALLWYLIARRFGMLESIHLHLQILGWSFASYAYNSLTRVFMGMFYCPEVDTDQGDFVGYAVSQGHYWGWDTRFKCGENGRSLHFVVGAVGCAIFSVGFPLCLTYFIFKNRARLEEPGFEGAFGFLYAGYKPKSAFWEAVIMLRKFLMASVDVFARLFGVGLQGIFLVGVMIIALAFQSWFTPFKSPLLNSIETTSLVITSLTFLAGALFHYPNFSSNCQWIFGVLVFSANISYSLYLFYLIWQALRTSQDIHTYKETVHANTSKYVQTLRAKMDPLWNLVVDLSRKLGLALIRSG